MKSSSRGRPPRLAICSQAARRMSNPVTTAPSRFAVAIAWRPATPAPRTITLAGATLAPASEYSGSGWPDSAPAPDSTATSISSPVRERTTSGISATRRSPSRDSLGTPTLICSRESLFDPRRPGRKRKHGGAGVHASARGALRGLADRRQLGQALDRVEPLLALSADRGDDQAIHPRHDVALQTIAHLRLGTDQRGGVDELVRDLVVGL